MQLKAKSALLALIAVFAVSAVSTAAASATTPEFKPVPTKNKFTGTGGAVVWTFDSGSETMTCSNTSLSGDVTSARTVGKLAVVFTGCTTTGATKEKCSVSSVGAKAGEIVTDALDGELGTVATTEAPSGVGIWLKPESGKTWTVLEGNGCTGSTSVTGAIVAEVTTIGKKQTTNKLVIPKNRFEEITLDSGKKQEVVGFTAWGSNLDLQAQNEVKFEEALEVT